LLSAPDSSLKSLLLHWNKIRGKGATLLAKAIKVNDTLQIFDASFNSFGSGPLAKKKGQARREEGGQN